MNRVSFVLASIVSRAISFMIVGVLFRLFGAPIKAFIDKYLGLVTIGFVGGITVTGAITPKLLRICGNSVTLRLIGMPHRPGCRSRQPPVDRPAPPRFEKRIRLAERLRAEETRVGRQRAGVCAGEDEVGRIRAQPGHPRRLFAGMDSP